MKRKKKILVIGRDPNTLQGVVDMLNKSGYEARGESFDDNALDTFKKFEFDAVLLGGGVSSISQEFLIPAFLKVNPQIKIAKGHPWQALEALRIALKNKVNP